MARDCEARSLALDHLERLQVVSHRLSLEVVVIFPGLEHLPGERFALGEQRLDRFHALTTEDGRVVDRVQLAGVRVDRRQKRQRVRVVVRIGIRVSSAGECQRCDPTVKFSPLTSTA